MIQGKKDQEKLRFLLEVTGLEKKHLEQTSERLFQETIDAAWVKNLEANPDLSERLDAFVARFGRLQDTIGNKLVPEFLNELLETPGSMLDNLNRMEKLGLLRSVVDWVEARNLRNQLVHEYMRDPEAFSHALQEAHKLVPMLTEAYDKIRDHADQHLKTGA